MAHAYANQRSLTVDWIINFQVTDGTTKKVWRVDTDALDTAFNAAGDYLPTFDAYSDTIVDAGDRKFAAGLLEADGSVFIRAGEI